MVSISIERLMLDALYSALFSSLRSITYRPLFPYSAIVKKILSLDVESMVGLSGGGGGIMGRTQFLNQITKAYIPPERKIICIAKSFALGIFASPNTKDSTFALPNARNTNMLVSFALGDANFIRVG